MNKIPFHKGVYILPNLITTGSLFCGFLAIIFSTKAMFGQAAVAIFFSALLDGLDGKVARLTNTSSEFGVQYDSLADLVAFGVAPALLIFNWQLAGFGRAGLAVCFIFMACGAMRLARFNVSTSSVNKKFFVGLPIPAAGCTLAALIFFVPNLPETVLLYLPAFCLALTFILACLMVSRVRYFSFKDYGFLKAYPFRSMVAVIILFACVFVNPKMLAFVLLAGYILVGLGYTISLVVLKRPKHIKN